MLLVLPSILCAKSLLHIKRTGLFAFRDYFHRGFVAVVVFTRSLWLSELIGIIEAGKASDSFSQKQLPFYIYINIYIYITCSITFLTSYCSHLLLYNVFSPSFYYLFLISCFLFLFFYDLFFISLPSSLAIIFLFPSPLLGVLPSFY